MSNATANAMKKSCKRNGNERQWRGNGCAMRVCIAIAIARQWQAIYHGNIIRLACMSLARPRKAQQ
jgi:hypothetical protein